MYNKIPSYVIPLPFQEKRWFFQISSKVPSVMTPESIFLASIKPAINLIVNELFTIYFWSCRSVYRRQDVCVAKVILWILSSCTYWWENRYPYPPLLHDGTTPHSWLMIPLPILGWWPPTHTWLMTPPYLAWPPHSWLMTPPPILGWWPPHTWLK